MKLALFQAGRIASSIRLKRMRYWSIMHCLKFSLARLRIIESYFSQAYLQQARRVPRRLRLRPRD